MENLGRNPIKVLIKTVKTKTGNKSLVYLHEYKRVGDLKLGKAEFWNKKKQEPGDPARLLKTRGHEEARKTPDWRLQIKGESWIKTSALMHMHTQIYNLNYIRRLLCALTSLFRSWEKVNFQYRLLKSICLKKHKMLLKIEQEKLKNRSNFFQFTNWTSVMFIRSLTMHLDAHAKP